METKQLSLSQEIFGKKYKLTKKLGKGAFGEIFHAYHVDTHEEFAIKLEPRGASHNQLFAEARLYQYFSKDKQFVFTGLPQLYSYFNEGDYNVMVMDLLGPSLEDLFNLCKRKFSVKTVMMLADQMVKRLEYVHSRNFLHRDIKPDNFVIGIQKNSHKVYILDFGLAKRFLKYGEHIPSREGKNLTGTARYASINTHLGFEQSRRDDLECLGHVLFYFLLGKLPWQGLKAQNKIEKYEKIMEKKASTSPEVLCKDHPEQFKTYLEYCRKLGFTDKPDYTYLRKLFKTGMIKYEFQCDYKYDWVIIAKQRKKELEKQKKEKKQQEEVKKCVMEKQPEQFTRKRISQFVKQESKNKRQKKLKNKKKKM